jgi:hypothetical protein
MPPSSGQKNNRVSKLRYKTKGKDCGYVRYPMCCIALLPVVAFLICVVN